MPSSTWGGMHRGVPCFTGSRTSPLLSALPPPQVQYAFLAGLALVLLLIPVNRLLATRIQRASVQMMAAKDRCCFGVQRCRWQAGRQNSCACLLRIECRWACSRLGKGLPVVCRRRLRTPSLLDGNPQAAPAVLPRCACRVLCVPCRRIGVMLELLRGIRQVKAYAWESLFAGKVQEERGAELAALAVRKYLDALCVYFWSVWWLSEG